MVPNKLVYCVHNQLYENIPLSISRSVMPLALHHHETIDGHGITINKHRNMLERKETKTATPRTPGGCGVKMAIRMETMKILRRVRIDSQSR